MVVRQTSRNSTMRKFLCLFWVTALGVSAVAADSSATKSARLDARMMRYPDVSATHITFVYAGDIWVVSKSGGEAVRLSSPRGEE